MTKSDVIAFLDKNRWTPADQKQLVEVYNDLRGDKLGKIGPNSVRTPCRVRQIVTSLRQFANAEMK